MVFMTELEFTKMHGLGNCFVVMDDRRGSVSEGRDVFELARAVCDRNFGIGADGLVLIGHSSKADYRMRIINEDGSEAEMCGNAVRCVARYLFDQRITGERDLEFETLAGPIKTRLLDDGQVEVDMGRPVLRNGDVVSAGADDVVSVEEQGHELTYVSMGNPHAVSFVNDLDFDWRALGALIERGASFPNKTNVEFVRVVDDGEVEVKVWERGCGETLACGTGACAVVVAGTLRGLLSRSPVTVHLSGGDLRILWNKAGRVMMTGPARTVCRGVYFAGV